MSAVKFAAWSRRAARRVAEWLRGDEAANWAAPEYVNGALETAELIEQTVTAGR